MNLIGAFPKLSEEERDWLVSSSETLHFGSGDTVIAEGTTIDSLLLIKSGFLRVTRIYLDEICAEFAGPLGPGENVPDGRQGRQRQPCRRRSGGNPIRPQRRSVGTADRRYRFRGPVLRKSISGCHPQAALDQPARDAGPTLIRASAFHLP
jgi:hypothetical protein